jgi:hypothetical protein
LSYTITQLGARVTPELLDSGRRRTGYNRRLGHSGCDFALITHGEQRRTSSRRELTVMMERMRKGLTVEISSELQTVLEKARNLFFKNVGEHQSTGDVLLGFLNQRVISSG